MQGPIFVRLRVRRICCRPRAAWRRSERRCSSTASPRLPTRQRLARLAGRSRRRGPLGARRLQRRRSGLAGMAWARSARGNAGSAIAVSSATCLQSSPASASTSNPGCGCRKANVTWPMALDPAEPLYRDEADRRATAAILEHRRWAADRQLNGWRFGAVRDDRRKHHPDLIPFDELVRRDPGSRLQDRRLARHATCPERNRAGLRRALRPETRSKPRPSCAP